MKVYENTSRKTTKEMKLLLNKLADLAYQASEEVYDEGGEITEILNLCDTLYEKIDNYLGKEEYELLNEN